MMMDQAVDYDEGSVIPPVGPREMGKLIAPQELTVPEALKAYARPKEKNPKIQIFRTFLVYPKNSFSLLITPPISICSLAAVLESADYDVDPVDAQGEGVETIWATDCGRYSVHGLNIEQTVARVSPNADIVGISVLFSIGWPTYRELINQIRETYPDLTIVLGGEHVSALGMFVMDDCPAVDYAIAGEGELSFLELVYKLTAGEPVSEVKGLYYRDKSGKVISNGGSPRVADVDNLPLPAWHKIDLERYFKSEITPPGGVTARRSMPVYGNRGCPYKCTFCSSVNMWTTRYQTRDPIKFVDEIEEYVVKYDVDMIQICDLTMFVNAKWMKSFCNEIKRRDLKLNWEMPSGTRSEALDLETLGLMRDVGCNMLVYAPESGSKRVLEAIQKQVDLNRLTTSIGHALDLGFNIRMGFIVGLPMETRSDILRTVLYGMRLAWMGVHDSLYSLFSPYPGSPLFHELREDGTIPEINDDYFNSLSSILDTTVTFSFCKQIGGRELGLWRILAFVAFYATSYISHPGRTFNLLVNIFSKQFIPQNVFESRMHQRFVRKTLAESE